MLCVDALGLCSKQMSSEGQNSGRPTGAHVWLLGMCGVPQCTHAAAHNAQPTNWSFKWSCYVDPEGTKRVIV